MASTALSQPLLLPVKARTPASPWRRFWYRSLRSPQGVIGGLLVLLFAVLAIVGPSVAPYSPTTMTMTKRLSPPSAQFMMGTDDFGRDIESRILYGAGASFQVGTLSVAVALVVGTLLGLLAGYRGGWLDVGLMSAMDVIFAFPAVLLAIAIMAVLQQSLNNVILAIGIVNLPVFVRVARSAVLSVKALPYIEAARSIGVPGLLIAFRHTLPNILAPLIVQGSLTVAAAILTEAALSFLGLGNPPPAPSWGNMLATGYQFMETTVWPSIIPGAAIMLAVLGFNLLGDGLRDIIDPTTRD
jgi:peptide/nickel transport system permease protein